MGINRNKPVKPMGTRSRASKNAKAEKAAKRAAKAQAKFRVLQFLRDHRKPPNTLKDAWQYARQAELTGELSGVPGYPTATTWVKEADELEAATGRDGAAGAEGRRGPRGFRGASRRPLQGALR